MYLALSFNAGASLSYVQMVHFSWM